VRRLIGAFNGSFGKIVAGLIAEGQIRRAVLMPFNNYGFGRKFAWLNDRFAVSWHFNLA
jgi:uncharacterized glyoxalase superfamily protein PhnB